jgi:hypothetical protein
MNARVLVVPAIAGIAAVAYWLSAKPDIPAATWRIGIGTEIRQGKNYDELAPESPIRLSFACAQPRHLYVLSHSQEDGTVVLFPSPEVRGSLANPLSGGNSVLPGKLEDKELAWTTRSGVSATTVFLVVAARDPIAELEALLPKLRRWTNSVLPDRTMLVTKPEAGTEVLGPARAPLPLPLLQRAADTSVTAVTINGPLHPDTVYPWVWIGSWRVKEARAEPAKK